MPTPARIEAEILAQAGSRGPDKSVCPSEVARALHEGADGAWQSLMGPVRAEAVRLARAGRIEILRKGKPVEPGDVRGVIRLRAKAG